MLSLGGPGSSRPRAQPSMDADFVSFCVKVPRLEVAKCSLLQELEPGECAKTIVCGLEFRAFCSDKSEADALSQLRNGAEKTAAAVAKKHAEELSQRKQTIHRLKSEISDAQKVHTQEQETLNDELHSLRRRLDRQEKSHKNAVEDATAAVQNSNREKIRTLESSAAKLKLDLASARAQNDADLEAGRANARREISAAVASQCQELEAKVQRLESDLRTADARMIPIVDSFRCEKNELQKAVNEANDKNVHLLENSQRVLAAQQAEARQREKDLEAKCEREREKIYPYLRLLRSGPEKGAVGENLVRQVFENTKHELSLGGSLKDVHILPGHADFHWLLNEKHACMIEVKYVAALKRNYYKEFEDHLREMAQKRDLGYAVNSAMFVSLEATNANAPKFDVTEISGYPVLFVTRNKDDGLSAYDMIVQGFRFMKMYVELFEKSRGSQCDQDRLTLKKCIVDIYKAHVEDVKSIKDMHAIIARLENTQNERLDALNRLPTEYSVVTQQANAAKRQKK